MTNGSIFHTLARKDTVGSVQPDRHTTIQRVAASLSRRNVDMATVLLLNEAHSRLIELCYERDETSNLVNVDAATGKILVPVPWGKAGHRKWALSPSEADALRAIMFTRQHNGLPLFFFDRSRRSWYADIATYAAMPRLTEWEIGVGELRDARGSLRGSQGASPGGGGGGGG